MVGSVGYSALLSALEKGGQWQLAVLGMTEMSETEMKTKAAIAGVGALQLGGGFKYLLCSPLPRETIQVDQYFFNWVETTNQVLHIGKFDVLMQLDFFFWGGR